MTIKEFFSQEITQDLVDYLLNLQVPPILIYNDKVLKVKVDVGDLTYGQWIALCEMNVKTDYDFVRAIILLFHWKDIMGDKIFDLDNYELEMDWVDNCEIKSYYLVAKAYKELVEKQRKLETDTLNYIPKAEQAMAGVDRFNKYGFFGTLYNLGKEFGVKPTEILNWGYQEVFLCLQYEKDSNEFQEAYSNIIMNKSK